tara:strand:- start:2138 stop:2989 length:852 start_codon:yes stop_codon:yes gene_type:complete
MKIGLLGLAVELMKNGVFSDVNNVMDMGTKTLRVHYDDLKYLFDQSGIKFNTKKFSFLKKFPKGKRVSNKLFWEEIGIKKYNCLDINEEKGSEFVDLNLPYNNKKHLKKYDLVMDFGNNEHVFNVGEAYKTMYNLAKKNGFLWIYQSVFNGNGFFQYDIPFFEGFALANKMNILHSAYVIGTDDYNQFLIPANKELFNTLDLNRVKSVDISYILKKNFNDDFKYFYQYHLNEKKLEPFNVSFITSKFPPERYYIQSKSIKKMKELAKKGDVDCIEWLRATGHY